MYIYTFGLGLFLGIVITVCIVLWRKNFVGIIQITFNEEEEKVLYSLELYDDPESLMTEKEARFRVHISEEEDDRG